MVRLSGYPKYILKRFKATVINDIWPELTFFTLVATMVCLVSRFQTNLGINPQMLTVLGTILGLVVSFRTSSAYDRYWEGRKLWSSIALASRQLTQVIWIHVPIDRKRNDTTPANLSDAELQVRAMLEKRTMIGLIQAYSVAMKHFLRGETGIFYEDLFPLVAFLPRYVASPSQSYVHPPPGSSYTTPGESLNLGSGANGGDVGGSATGSGEKGGAPAPAPLDTDQLPLWFQAEPSKPFKKRPLSRAKTFQPEKVLPTIHTSSTLRPARNPPKTTIFEYLPFLIPFRWLAKTIGKIVSRRVRAAIAASVASDGGERGISGKVKKPVKVESNVPLEITLFLSSYLGFLLKNGLLQAALATAYANQMQGLQDCILSLERVRNTPIPFAYQVHLRLCIWLYLILLPFEIYNSFGYVTIPMTLFAAFLILGFLEIGQEIENPFSYEENDLDLDGFCLAIQRELHEITAHIVVDPNDFIFSGSNQPLAPMDRTDAGELMKNSPYVQEGGVSTLRKTLLHNWQQVNEATRDHELV